jgi:RNA polymerase primary sigma factor
MRSLKITQQITQRTEQSVNLYFQEINKYPMISVDEEVELSVRIHKGDEEALQKLVRANLRFVISVAKQYQNQGLSFSDLINEGNVGLVVAARKFDETRGFKFISYAVWWIRQSIMQAIAQQTRTVRLPLNRLSSIHKITKAITNLEQQYQREPTNSELADYLEVNEEVIATNNSIKHRQVSFDKPLNTNTESDFSLYDLVQSDNIPAPDKELLLDSLKINLHRALSKLSIKEAEIISLSYGLNKNKVHSLSEIALLMGISTERVRQIRSYGLQKMKQLLKNKTLFLQDI